MPIALLVAASTSLHFPDYSTRVVGVQPRGNAVVRDAKPGSSGTAVSPSQTRQLRVSAYENLGLNINDYWTLRSGTISTAIPEQNLSEQAKARRKKIQDAADAADQRREKAETRLQLLVRDGPGCVDNSRRASARLCAALHEARRLECRDVKLVAKAEALLVLLERAAVEQAVVREHTAAADEESARREWLVHRMAQQSTEWSP